jgi:hypothetical protein
MSYSFTMLAAVGISNEKSNKNAYGNGQKMLCGQHENCDVALVPALDLQEAEAEQAVEWLLLSVPFVFLQ